MRTQTQHRLLVVLFLLLLFGLCLGLSLVPANDTTDVDHVKQPLIQPAGGHRHFDIFPELVLSLRVGVEGEVKQALELDNRRRLGSLPELRMGEVEHVCEERGLRKEEVPLEGGEARDELLVAE